MNVQTMPRSTPAWRPVILEQFRAMGINLRRAFALLGLGMLCLSLVVAATEMREAADPRLRHDIDLNLSLLSPLLLVAMFAPLALWKLESPARRSYHWAMPVDRVKHTLARVLVGWAWLMPLVALTMLWGAAMAWLTGGTIGQLEHVTFDVAADRFVGVPYSMPAWQWVAPFVGVTVAYLLGSALVVATESPWLWMAGIWLGFMMVNVTLFAAGIETEIVEELIGGRFGLFTSFAGEVMVVETALRASGEVATVHRSVPDLAAWLGSSALWLSIALGATLLAARRHPEA